MKTIYLLRHAKSSWSDPSLDDFDRPLNNRGNRNAPFMANLFKEKNLPLECFVSSPALRAKVTAEVFAQTLGFQNLQLDKRIYEASESELVTILEELLEIHNTVMLAGHNPTLTDVTNYLCSEVIANVPTSAFVGISVPSATLSKHCGKLLMFEYPKKYLD